MTYENQGLSGALGIESARLYNVEFIAALLGVHQGSVYQSLAGRKSVPLPVATRLGRGIRFKGRDILVFLGEDLTPPTAREARDPIARRGPGRPRLQAGRERGKPGEAA